MKIYNTSDKYALLVLTAIVIISTYIYADIGDHVFLFWDDLDHVTNNVHLKTISFDNLYWIFTSVDQIMWHPVTSLSHMISFELFGENVLAFKLTNIVIHIINSMFVYFVTYRLLKLYATNVIKTSDYRSHPQYLVLSSALTSLCFSLHPIHIESVIWVIERKDVLYAFFFLSAILAYLKSKDTDHKKTWQSMTMLLFILSLASKPMAVTFPFLLMFFDYYIFDTEKNCCSWIRRLLNITKDKIVMILIAASFSIITLITQDSAIQGFNALSLLHRLVGIFESLFHYYVNIFFPSNISPFYPLPDYKQYPTAFFIVMSIVSAAIIYYLIRLYSNKTKAPLLSLLFFLITILPVIGLVKVGYAAYADRYTYIPSISLHILIGGTLSKLFFTKSPKLFLSIVGVLIFGYILSLAFFSKEYSKLWSNDEALWSKVITDSPYKSELAYVNYGNAVFRKKGCAQAKQFYHIALAINASQIEALQNLAKCHRESGNLKLATYYYNLLAFRNLNSSRALLIAGDYFYNIRELPSAETYYHRALINSPANPNVIFKNAVIDYITLKKDDAKTKIGYILQLDPNHLGALQLITKLEYDNNNYLLSAEYAAKVISIDPDDQFANFILKSVKQ